MNVLIPKGLNDQRPEVKGAALKAINYFSEWLCPEILTYDNIIIPQIIESLANPESKVREKSLMTIDTFAENMEAQ